MYHCRDYWPMGYVFSRTAFNGYWDDFVPKQYQFDDYYPDVMERILEVQKKKTQYVRENPDEELDPRIFIILDDCTDDRTRYDNTLHRLYFTARHFNITLIQTAQYLKTLPPGIRSNCDLAVTLVQHQEMQREVLANDFLTDIPKKEVFQILDNMVPPMGSPDEVCELYKGLFLALNLRENERCGRDRLYYGKAHDVDRDAFLLGSIEYWGDELGPRIQQYEKRKEKKRKEAPSNNPRGWTRVQDPNKRPRKSK